MFQFRRLSIFSGIFHLRSFSTISIPSFTPISIPPIAASLENNAAYRFLKSKPEYSPTFFNPESLESKWSTFNPIIDNFRQFLSPGREFTSDFQSEIIQDFKPQDLSDDELKSLLYLTTLPFLLPRPTSSNFEKFWKSLDDEIILRSKGWPLSECFGVNELWFVNRLHKYAYFNWALVKRLFRKCDKLTKVEFIRFMFSLNLVRNIPKAINTYELEHCLSQHLESLSSIEVCIAAMAFFKTETPIRDNDLLVKFIETGISEASTLDSIFVAALAKIGRLSGRGKSSHILYAFQEKFIPEIPRLTMASAMHLAIIGTRTQLLNDNMVLAVLQKAEGELTQTRLKEIERLLLVLTMFNIQCDKFCHLVVEELRKTSRENEIKTYGQVFDSILFYLAIKEIYPFDLITRVFDKENVRLNYGKNSQRYSRELVCLDFTLGLECPEYKGNRLEPKTVKSAIRYNMLWLWPETKEKVSAYEHSVRTVAQIMRKILGSDQFVYTCNILPQFHSAEVVFFLDGTNKPVAIPPEFKSILPEEIKRIPGELQSCSAHALLVCSNNTVIRNRERTVLGQVYMQERQLKKLRYKVHLVLPEDFFIKLEETDTDVTRRKREEYFHNLINSQRQNQNQ